jgi:uncharacterized protein YecT (DUF1311 family)
MRLAIMVVAVLAVLPASIAAAQTQMELNAQAGADLRKSDERLNTVYRALRAKISDAGKAKLQAAQQSWLRFRDQECEFETMGTVGGSIHSMIVANCLARLTDQRVKDLEAQLNCQEGDLSCGGQ